MADISSVSGLAGATQATGSSPKELTDQFLQLLVAQLKNQDPLDPVKNEDFVSELAQLQSLEQSIKLTDSNQSLLLQSSLSTGSSLLGREVSGIVNIGNGELVDVTGVVKGVRVEAGKVLYTIEDADGNQLQLTPENLTSVNEAV